MDHPGWRGYTSVSSASKKRSFRRNETVLETMDVHLNRLPSYSELLRRIGPAAARELTDCKGPNVPVPLLPGVAMTRNERDDIDHRQAIDRELLREMRLAEEALRGREVLGVRRWLQLQRQWQMTLAPGNVAGDPYSCRPLKHKPPLERGQGRCASNAGVATCPKFTSRFACCPELAVDTKTSRSSDRVDRRELDKDCRAASESCWGKQCGRRASKSPYGGAC